MEQMEQKYKRLIISIYFISEPVKPVPRRSTLFHCVPMFHCSKRKIDLQTT